MPIIIANNQSNVHKYFISRWNIPIYNNNNNNNNWTFISASYSNTSVYAEFNSNPKLGRGCIKRKNTSEWDVS